MSLVEKVCRALCDGARNNRQLPCPLCDDDGSCVMWATFDVEAKQAIAAIRRHDRGK